MKALKGKIALVTGGARGIGRAIVKDLVNSGALVAINYNSSEDYAKKLLEDQGENARNSITVKADVGKFHEAENMVQKVIETFGRIDILVNNAGIARDKNLAFMEQEDWDAVMAVDLKGVFNVSRAAIVPLLKQQSGSIVNISSISGFMGRPGQTNYAAAKAGIIGFSKALSKEAGRFGVTVNTVAPGFIETEMLEGLNEKMKEKELKQIPLRRFGKPSEVASLVTFLASDDARYITGQVFVIDGGLSA